MGRHAIRMYALDPAVLCTTPRGADRLTRVQRGGMCEFLLVCDESDLGLVGGARVRSSQAQITTALNPTMGVAFNTATFHQFSIWHLATMSRLL